MTKPTSTSAAPTLPLRPTGMGETKSGKGGRGTVHSLFTLDEKGRRERDGDGDGTGEYVS